ncbi:MAG TPA: threonine/serine dehydratase [Flexivirga sp.]|uniref:threonine/serine dehydratase n=1 Tax=Flexivirga sp. TaxID=1962927 RepID=UPI002B76E6BD|nr:threonine/serine dehydratase [Flexivirga sp.]HWC21892.1 threonine/serine dehydratase [Flexivirga sp.]
MADAPLPGIDEIRAAAVRIGPHIRHTSTPRSDHLSAMTGGEVHLKLEIEQPTGSFKVRGACNAILSATERGHLPGVTTASTGNHARAVAYMGGRFGLPVSAFLAESVPAYRARALEELGATVDRNSRDQGEAIAAAREQATERGYAFVPPFDHPDVISGQGTIGLELCADLADLDAVVVPVSGGGLISGIGLAIKAIRPETLVIGVCAERADAMLRSLDAGHPVPVPEVDTLATSLLGDLGADNRYTFRAAGRVVDEISSVSEQQLQDALDVLATQDGLVVEGAAAAAVAYLRATAARWRGKRVAALVTGNTVDPGNS